MPRPSPVRRPSRRSRSTLLTAPLLLVACTAREPLQEEATPEQLSIPPTPVTSIPSDLPSRTLPPPDAASTAPPLSLTASDGTGLRLVSLQANASVQEPLAYTELHLVFENPENRTLEGRFTIDLPPRAAISRLAMKIDGRWQEGEVLERQAARVAYEDFLHRKQDPALMEKEAGNRFSARVFPIPAKGTKELIVSYSQELPDAEEPYRLPLRGLPELDAFDARILVDRPAGEPTPGGTATKREVIEIHETHHMPDRDLEVAAFRPRHAVGLRNDDIAMARVTVEGSLAPEPLTDLTILFDTSASRALGFDAKVRQLGEVIEALRSRAGDFSLRVAAFDQDMSLVFDGKASGFGAEHLQALYTRRALGASDLASALRRVATISGSDGRVLLMTDGVTTAGDDEVSELTAAAQSLERVGVGRIDAIIDGGLQDRAVLQQITTALARNGTVADADRPPARLADALLRTTLPDVAISVEGSTWSWPRTVEGLQPGDEVLVYANLPKSAAMTVVLEGTETIRTEVPLTAVDRPLLQRAWTGARIQDLQLQRSQLDPGDTGGRVRLQQRIVDLSVTHRVLSDFTALLVLETEWDYERFGFTRRGLSDILVVGPHGLEWLARDEPKGEPTASRPSPTDAIPQMARAFDPDLGAVEPPPPDSSLPMMNDDEDVWGGLTGTEVGESFGVGGLGLVGTGRGGGGTGEGTVGIGNTGLIGKGGGSSKRSGYGRGAGAGFGGRGRQVPRVRMAKATVQGTLDRDIIRRIVRAHINEVRYCYNQGLERDPNLHGRVTVQFAIDPQGKVPSSAVAESTLPDASVSTCIARAVKRWKFPKPPSSGLVLVTHPFVLSPGDGPAPRPEPLTPEQEAQIAEAQRAAEARDAQRIEEEARRAAEAKRTEGSPYEGRMFDVMKALEADQIDAALQMALQWRDESPGDVVALLALGEALERQGRLHAAARAYGSILELFPSRADLRRHAGSRLERLGDDAALTLAIDTHRHAVEQRPDHPSSHRMLAFALTRAGMYESAFDALVFGLEQKYPEDRFEAAQRILSEDAGLVAAAWVHDQPARADEIHTRAAKAGVTIATAASTRFVMTWETDANDVDFHVYDGNGDHAYYRERSLPSGGALYADVRDGYGPECFAIEGVPKAYPYRFEANYFSRGPMGYGMGALQVVEHDGSGGLYLETRPFVIMKDHADVTLGRLEGTLARKG
ncbi:AgmX/PglI C-terminal domain-containing protein [Paraliomyxa miuraensis]|uniref:AgmX/PglI C-terminal domain-containing protein n=1 Tax=Paraliomyxa miuraensis TaxID=376150 RepID=UPI002253EFFD|nr:AgmX/PglI C-terminal domain-containing protein [Paraliomyxa miuraensis]MCX4246880.1 AgmX/PglI C-terminal domain-containing protein [Paraliomyxa miuraensis]